MKLGQGRIAARLAEIGQEFGHGLGLELGRIAAALEAMGRPQDHLAPVLHVAGTNGKGSVCAYLRAIGEAGGLRVHVFTSPHLIAPNERIRLAGQLISDDAFLTVLDEVGACGVRLTYFEAITAAAILAFARTPADWIVMEVGLGGRFDATNILDTAISVITPLGLDHQAFLGPDLAAIAMAKAGILRAGHPAVIARQPEAAMAVIESEGAKLGTSLLRAGREWDAYAQNGQLIVQTPDFLHALPAPTLAGPHQFENAGLAVMAALSMRDPRVSPDALARGLAQASWPGRMQALTRGPLVLLAGGAELWLDGGHNPHAALALAATLRAMQARRPAKLGLVVAMLETKDASQFLAPLASLSPDIFPFTVEADQAWHKPQALVRMAQTHGLKANAADSLEQAIFHAAHAGCGRILITGSLHLVGAALVANGNHDLVTA